MEPMSPVRIATGIPRMMSGMRMEMMIMKRIEDVIGLKVSQGSCVQVRFRAFDYAESN